MFVLHEQDCVSLALDVTQESVHRYAVITHPVKKSPTESAIKTEHFSGQIRHLEIIQYLRISVFFDPVFDQLNVCLLSCLHRSLLFLHRAQVDKCECLDFLGYSNVNSDFLKSALVISFD